MIFRVIDLMVKVTDNIFLLWTFRWTHNNRWIAVRDHFMTLILHNFFILLC